MLGLRFMFNAHDDAFGPQRMFWGTDISGGYRENVELFTRELSWLSAAILNGSWVAAGSASGTAGQFRVRRAPRFVRKSAQS